MYQRKKLDAIFDSDHLMAKGEVGRQGMAVDSLADIETVYDGIDIGEAFIGSVVS
jgi:methylmalonyl-CoA mutase N-terminal domain/subunit